MRNIFKISIALIIVSFVAACGAKKKEVTREDRIQAGKAAGEASYANFRGDFAAAERALVRAVELDPFNADNWFDLGIARIRIKDKSGAKAAFKEVLSVCKDNAAKDPNNVAWLVKQIRPMVLLNRVSDARALQEKILKQFPNDRQVGVFADAKAIDKLLEDPLWKELNS